MPEPSKTSKQHLALIVLEGLQKFIPGVLFTQNDRYDDGEILAPIVLLRKMYSCFSFLSADFLIAKKKDLPQSFLDMLKPEPLPKLKLSLP